MSYLCPVSWSILRFFFRRLNAATTCSDSFRGNFGRQWTLDQWSYLSFNRVMNKSCYAQSNQYGARLPNIGKFAWIVHTCWILTSPPSFPAPPPCFSLWMFFTWAKKAFKFIVDHIEETVGHFSCKSKILSSSTFVNLSQTLLKIKSRFEQTALSLHLSRPSLLPSSSLVINDKGYLSDIW